MANWEICEDVRACPDCVTFSANGTGDLDTATVQRVAAGFDRYGDGATFSADTDTDTGEFTDSGFTWSSCDVCGLTLGHDYVRGSMSWTVA